MLIVSKGKVVVGRRIVELGGELEGLTPEAEEQLIAVGVAKRVGSDAYVEPDADDDGVQVVPIAKEPSKAELQERCRELGVSTRGNKAELQARIAEAEAALDDGEERDVSDDDEPEDDELEDEEPPELSAEVPR